MDGHSHSKQARIEYLDIFRSLGIILMIMGHVYFGGFFSKWIHAFHMPMFFFVSGWFYKSNDLTVGKSILRKAKSLLIPYLCFEIIVFVLSLPLIPEYLNVQTLYYILFDNTYIIPVAVCNKSHIAVIIIAIFGMIAPKILPFRLPWALDAAFVGIGFFHIARAIKGTKAERILHIKLWQALLTGVFFSALIMVCPRINMRTGNYGVYLPFWINALGAIIAGWNIARYVEGLLVRGKIGKTVATWLKGIGKNSIVYLCLNQIVILIVMYVFEMAGINGFNAKVPILIITMSILFIIEKLICNTKLKVIIGK